MVEIDQIVNDKQEIDNYKLVLFLGQMNENINTFGDRFERHLEAEEANFSETKELVEIIKSFKLVLGILKWTAGVVAIMTPIGIWIKEHIKF